MSTGKIRMEIYFWVIGIVLLLTPILLSVFAAFLILTYRIGDENIFEYGSWLDEDDKNA